MWQRQILSLEINQVCEVPSSCAVKQLRPFMQIFSLLGSFSQLCGNGIGASSSNRSELASFLACTRSHPIWTSMLRQLCGLAGHEGRSVWKTHATASTYAAVRSGIIAFLP